MEAVVSTFPPQKFRQHRSKRVAYREVNDPTGVAGAHELRHGKQGVVDRAGRPVPVRRHVRRDNREGLEKWARLARVSYEGKDREERQMDTRYRRRRDLRREGAPK